MSSLVDSQSVVTLRTIAIAVVATMEVVLGTDKTFAEQGAYYYSLTKDQGHCHFAIYLACGWSLSLANFSKHLWRVAKYLQTLLHF